ncbi:uncharacterized protein LOC128875173 [Hylaeus volcanicus]|uniref:uncharacterized protein LOC128875173 n=1 Tax=Hylaeus volcanicus TaxID=313075 RepID=UPI0023B87DF9|nr:uncharacterized protein LOC128875173 [Hylaeus volcanicus]
MKLIVAIVLSIVCVLCAVKQLQCARILGIVPTPSYSHQIPYRPLWIELNKRGHDVVLITPSPIPNLNLTNFTQIDIGESYDKLRSINFINRRFKQNGWLDFVYEILLNYCENIAHQVLNHTEVKKLYDPSSDAKFDMVMAETLYSPVMHSFAYRFNTPIIGLSSLGILGITEHSLGGFMLPSHEYTWEMEGHTGSDVSFWRRLHNFVAMWYNVNFLYDNLYTSQHIIAEKYFGIRLPPLIDMLKNTSMLFVNQADVMTPARPKLPNVITFTSFHVDEISKPLPKDLERFVDDAREGFIYFSLGSNALSSDLPRETMQVFLDVFAKLPYRVVWKFETEWLDKPDNIFTGKWLPQQSILAHPNIKLFLYQGGLQSSEEAVHFTVPLVGFPVLADQNYQVRRMEALGVGKHLDITTVTRDELESAIRELINDSKYKENMIKLKKIVNDNPYDLVEHLCWWTEYVIRHKGAPHLRSSLADLSWRHRNDIDVVMFLTIIAFIVIIIVFRITVKIIMHFGTGTKSRNWKQKKLAERGHDIVLIGTNYMNDLNGTNITQIIVDSPRDLIDKLDYISFRFKGISWITFNERFQGDLGTILSENVFENPAVKKLYAPNSNEKFDLVMAELLWTPSLFAFAHRFNAPLIGLSSLAIPMFHEYLIGGLVLPSHESTWEMEKKVGSNLSFWQRVQNYLIAWRLVYLSYRDQILPQQTLAEKYLGKDIPPLQDIIANVSVVFVNQDEYIYPARHKLPNVIPFSTLHISSNLPPMSKKLKRFVDNAKNGFVYLNFGTNVKCSFLPNKTMQTLLDVFTSLPYKLVWKCDKDLPVKSNNIFVLPWIPQQTILAHQNIKLFVYQGGLQSTEEAVHFAVPVLGLPVVADQDYQVHRMEALGVGKWLEMTTLKADELKSVTLEMINNKMYKQNMLKLKNLTKDRPYDFTKHLAWWTERFSLTFGISAILCNEKLPFYPSTIFFSNRVMLNMFYYIHITYTNYCQIRTTVIITRRNYVHRISTITSPIIMILVPTHRRRCQPHKIIDTITTFFSFSISAIGYSYSSSEFVNMKFTTVKILTILCVLSAIEYIRCARILGVIPTPSYSHQIMYTKLWLELGKRGHELVVVTTNPMSVLNIPNITQIDISSSYGSLKNYNFIRNRFENLDWLEWAQEKQADVIEMFSETVFSNQQVKDLYKPDSNQTFDVLIMEMMTISAIFAFAHRFKAPTIGVTSMTMSVTEEDTIGGLVLPSHESTWESKTYTGLNLSFWQRLYNFYNVWRHVYVISHTVTSSQQSIAEKYLGSDIPHLVDIMRNNSLLFVNQDDVVIPPKMRLPHIITYTSTHIGVNPTPLPKELTRFLEDANDGFIYFNLGTNAPSSFMPPETLQIFIDVFSRLPYKVVWKMEKKLDGMPNNVFTASWFSQQSVLGHPKVKLFMYQGGVQSSQEAVHFAVPVLGLPVMADQDFQVHKMENLGVGKSLELVTLTRTELEKAILEMVTNKRYKERMLEVRRMVQDAPYDIGKHLIWWTEYVIRHKGAPHLRSNLVWQPWHQQFDRDIVIFLTFVMCIAASFALFIANKITVFIYKQRQLLISKQKQKTG